MRQPVLAGVDATADGAFAGAVAFRLAQRTGKPCVIVHAVRDVVSPAGAPVPTDLEEIRCRAIQAARVEILSRLRGNMPEESFPAVEVLMGRPAQVIQDLVAERDAGLIVLGGKHHPALGRWLGGSTVLDVVRQATVPVLVTTPSAGQIERILVAMDLSKPAGEIVVAGERFAAQYGAELRFVHAVETVSLDPEEPELPSSERLFRAASAALEAEGWPAIAATAERVIRDGFAHRVIEREVAAWQAQLLVVGSNGMGRLHRFLLGSVTQGLIRKLPTSLLVVPVSRPR